MGHVEEEEETHGMTQQNQLNHHGYMTSQGSSIT